MRFLLMLVLGLTTTAAYAENEMVVTRCIGSGSQGQVSVDLQDVFGSRFSEAVVHTIMGSETFQIALGYPEIRALIVAASSSGRSLRIDFNPIVPDSALLTLGEDRGLNKSFKYQLTCSSVN